MQEMWVWSLGQEDPLEKGMAIHSSILAWEIPWTGEPGGLQSMRSRRVRHDWVTEHASTIKSLWNTHFNSDWGAELTKSSGCPQFSPLCFLTPLLCQNTFSHSSSKDSWALNPINFLFSYQKKFLMMSTSSIIREMQIKQISQILSHTH